MGIFDFFGQKDFYNFTLSGQPAAKVSTKTNTNISRKYYLARKIANQIYINKYSNSIIYDLHNLKRDFSVILLLYIFYNFYVKVVLFR